MDRPPMTHPCHNHPLVSEQLFWFLKLDGLLLALTLWTLMWPYMNMKVLAGECFLKDDLTNVFSERMNINWINKGEDCCSYEAQEQSTCGLPVTGLQAKQSNRIVKKVFWLLTIQTHQKRGGRFVFLFQLDNLASLFSFLLKADWGY